MTATRRSVLGAALLAAALFVTGCAGAPGADTEASSASTDASAGEFPVTIEHALGEATIDEKPERVVTLGTQSAEVAVSLGVVPVAVPTYAGVSDEDGYLPWLRDEVNERGGELPDLVRTTDAGEIDFEYILSMDPDVILAPHSGISETDYERLSEIAPTVAYAERPWAAPSYEDLHRTIGIALGEQERAEEVIQQIDQLYADERAAHPEFDGLSLVYGIAQGEGATELVFYPAGDPRVATMYRLGFVESPGAEEYIEAAGADAFYMGVSLEELDTLPADVWVGWYETEEAMERTLENPLLQAYTPFADDRYLFITDPQIMESAGSSNLLGLQWGLGKLTTQLSDVIASADAE